MNAYKKGALTITYEELELLRENVNSLYFDIKKIEKKINKTLQARKIAELTELKEQKEIEHEEARIIYIEAENTFLERSFKLWDI